MRIQCLFPVGGDRYVDVAKFPQKGFDNHLRRHAVLGVQHTDPPSGIKRMRFFAPVRVFARSRSFHVELQANLLILVEFETRTAHEAYSRKFVLTERRQHVFNGHGEALYRPLRPDCRRAIAVHVRLLSDPLHRFKERNFPHNFSSFSHDQNVRLVFSIDRV